jgi:hypothetical protein
MNRTEMSYEPHFKRPRFAFTASYYVQQTSQEYRALCQFESEHKIKTDLANLTPVANWKLRNYRHEDVQPQLCSGMHNIFLSNGSITLCLFESKYFEEKRNLPTELAIKCCSRVLSTPAPCSGGVGFKSRTGNLLSRLVIFVVFLSPSRQML